MKLDGRLLGMGRSARPALAAAVGLGLLAGVAVVGQAWALSHVVSLVFLDGRSLTEVTPLLVALLALALLRSALVWASEVVANRAAGQVKAEVRERFVAHLLTLGPAYTSGERSGELTNTAVEGVEALDAYLRQYLPQLALAALVPTAVLCFVLPLDWLSGLVLLLTAPLLPLFMALIGNLADGLARRQWTSLSRMSAHFLDVLQGLTTLKVLGRSREQAQTIADISDDFRRSTMGVLRVAFLSALVLEMVATVSTAVVAVQIGLRLLYGHLSFEQAFFVLILAPEFYLPLRLLGSRFHAGTAGAAAAQRIFQVLGTPVSMGAGLRGAKQSPLAEPGPTSATQSGRAPRVPAFDGFPPSPSAPPAVRFDDVYYAYEGGQRPALNGFSLSLAPGETVALVGPSGAGKSTVARLLLRFIEPDRGRITVGGQDVRDVGAAGRQQVAWVPQQPYLFSGSIADNIRLGRPEASPEDVAWAAAQAHAHEFIAALPQGYDTPVGERGCRLSGGEAQRIALARAFLKDAPLLILDEATANLDPEVEWRIQEAMDRLAAGRTVLLIGHRLTTLTRADRIAVVDGGRVIEEGTHATLMQRDGPYRRLVRAWSPEGARSVPCGLQAAKGEDQTVTQGGTRSETIVHQQTSAPEELARSRKGPATLWRLLALAAPFAGRMALAVLLGLATIGSSIGLMTTAAYIIARAALHPSIAELQVAIVGVRFFGIARGASRYLERVVAHDVTFRLLARLRVWFYQALEPLAPARLMQTRSGDLLARIVGDVDTLQDLFLRAIAPPAVAVLVAGLAAALVGSFAPSLPVAFGLAAPLLASLLLAGAGVPLLAHVLSQTAGTRLVQVRAELNSTLLDSIQGMPDLLAFGQEASILDRVRRLGRDLSAQQARLASIGGLHTALTGLLMNLATLGLLAVAIPLVTASRLDGVFLALLTLAVMSSFEAVLPLTQAAQAMGSSLEAGRRLFEIVDTQPAVTDARCPRPLPEQVCLRAEAVCFSYGPGLPPALDGISFELPPGKVLAVVGPSGAGKSTIISLLLRFWDVQAGRILLGDRELREYGQDDWRQRVAYVSQHTHLFNATVRENLLLARPDAGEQQMIRAAQKAQLHDFVQSLPHGYDTWIGEQGIRLSGGQRQRLAIARAILRDASLLILDEPTANLDAQTEQQVLASLWALAAGRSTLLATHRLVGLENADEILVLQAGQIVERGRHCELLDRNGLYRRMWELQGEVLWPSG